MATPQIHGRSISLPSRLNPTGFEVELQKLQISTDFPITSEAIQSGLVGLAESYNSVEALGQSAVHQDAKSMEESLSESVGLLDSCSIVRELCQMMKESIQSLQSALRRKGLSDPSIHNDITTYFCFRKKTTKSVAKTLKTLKNLQRKIGSVSSDHHSVNVESNFTSALRQVTGITVASLKSILMFLSFPVGFSEGWSFVSKLMLVKSGRGNDVMNEVGNADYALRTVQEKLRSGSKVVDGVQMLQKILQNVDATIQGFEGGLERLNGQLVQTRVILLNILTDH